MNILIQTYYIILPIVFTAFMGWIGAMIREQRNHAREIEERHAREAQEADIKREANATGTKLILFYMLQRLHTEYTYQDYVTHEQRTQFKELYDAYHALGGNGYGTRMWEDIEELDIRNDKDGVSPFIKILKDARNDE